MAGLHQCPRCEYRFEDADSLAAHTEDVPCDYPLGPDESSCYLCGEPTTNPALVCDDHN